MRILTVRAVSLMKLLFFLIFTNSILSSHATEGINAIEFPFAALNLQVDPEFTYIEPDQPIVIAIIDDGFLPDHASIRGMLWKNTEEIPNNLIDDDQNDFIDDIHDWDVADNDELITFPEFRRAEFRHGTMAMSILSQIIRKKLGALETYPIQFMLVKAVSDTSNNMKIEAGYEGIEYAINNGASVISNSWSGGVLDKDAKQTLNQARNKSIFIVNTVGNFPQEDPVHPASHPAIFGVGGISDDKKVSDKSNYGTEVDLVAYSERIPAASATDLNALKPTSGTSVTAPIIAATAALMKLVNHGITNPEIYDCLKNTAQPIDEFNLEIAGKLGAGLVNIDRAIDCAKNPEKYYTKQQRYHPEGTIGINSQKLDNTQRTTYKWEISPKGDYQSIHFSNIIEGEPNNSRIEFTSVEADRKPEILWSGKIIDLPSQLNLKRSATTIQLSLDQRDVENSLKFLSRYQVKTIDTEKRFCSDTRVITPEISTFSIISDGSKSENYSAKSNCKWHIQGVEGYSIQIEFTQLDIDSSDNVLLFAGDKTLNSHLLTSFSGKTPPPTFILKEGDALLWLVSDNSIQGQGFEAKITWKTKED